MKKLSNVLVLRLGIEARTLLARVEVMVPVDLHTRISELQVFDKSDESGPLCQCACVLGLLHVGSHAAYVANPDAVGVVATLGAVGSYEVDVTSGHDGPVTIDDIVVAYVAESSIPVPAAYIGNGKILAFRRGRAVDYDFLYGTVGSFPPCGQQLGECGGATYAIDLQAVGALKLLYC